MSLKHIAFLVSLMSVCAISANTVGGYRVVGPTETDRFITEVDGIKAPQGLDGKNIAMWQSHGWYFEPKLNRWEWQRARLFGTVEDLYTQTYVMPFLMPMLQNAGAYVMSPRERDTNLTEIIIDNDAARAVDGYTEASAAKRWGKSKLPGFAYTTENLTDLQNPFTEGTARQVATVTDASKASRATWTANIPADGQYAVYISYQSLPNSAKDAEYIIHTAAGDRHFKVNQQMGGGTWIYLGHFPLAKGQQAVVELTNISSDPNAVVTADAVKIGGGMGHVARKVKEPLDDIKYQYVTSGYPSFTEGARYWLQWAGAPDSVYTLSGNVNDYTDDYKCRGEWVNWLAGGSSILPGRPGLKIPVDLSFAFHSDAGTTKNDDIIGTLGIYFTNKGDKYANGTDRRASGTLTDYVMTAIVNDIRAQYEPNWTRRDMRDASYFEARVPEVPAMLLELLSHQNFADMKYGLDPTFRFTVSRAIYKAMLKFLSERDGKKYVVQPLAVNSMNITAEGNNHYVLSWQPTVDPLEATATPSEYIIEERINDGAFKKVATVNTLAWTTVVTDRDIHSYRVTAANAGGISFPSEVVVLCNMGDKPILVINGFTRVSGPDWFDSGDIAGFYHTRDHGVPYISEIGFIGDQFEFRRDIPWMDDDASGFGASRANYEGKVIAGNTFDYIYTHGKAIKNAGHGFISASAQAYIDAKTTPATTIDLILGKQKEIAVGRGVYGTKYKTFTQAMQQRLTEHCKRGGNLLVTGAYIATDLWDNPLSTDAQKSVDQKFAADILGYKWRVDQASVTGEAYQVPCRYPQLDKGGEYTFYNELNPEGYAVESPDSFYPANDYTSATFMRYKENNLIAATAMDNGTWKTLAIGFPFESIKASDKRDHLMKEALDFFAAPHKVVAKPEQPKTTTKGKATKKGKSKSKGKSKAKKKKKK